MSRFADMLAFVVILSATVGDANTALIGLGVRSVASFLVTASCYTLAWTDYIHWWSAKSSNKLKITSRGFTLNTHGAVGAIVGTGGAVIDPQIMNIGIHLMISLIPTAQMALRGICLMNFGHHEWVPRLALTHKSASIDHIVSTGVRVTYLKWLL